MKYLAAAGIVALAFLIGGPLILLVVWLPVFMLGTGGVAITLGVLALLTIYVIADEL